MLHNWHYMMLLYAEYLYCSIKLQFFCYEGHNIAYMHSNRYHLSLMSFECEGLRLNTEIAFLIFFCCKKIVKKFLIYFEKGEAFPSLARSLPEPFLSNDPIPAHSLQPPCISFMNCKCCLLLFHKENYNSWITNVRQACRWCGYWETFPLSIVGRQWPWQGGPLMLHIVQIFVKIVKYLCSKYFSLIRRIFFAVT